MLSPVQIQSARRRAAQAAAILMVAVGVCVLLASLASVLWVQIDPPPGWADLVALLAVALIGTAVTLFGRKLLRWGSGD